MRRLLYLVYFLAVTVSAQAQSGTDQGTPARGTNPSPPVDLPKAVKADPSFHGIPTFRCDFATGEGRDSFEEPNARIKDGQLGELIFDSLKYSEGTARLIGNIGSSNVSLIDGDLAVTFIELTDVGGIIVTTIFKGATVGLPLAQTYRAVASRHIARTFGGETTTQHYGTCKGLLP